MESYIIKCLDPTGYEYYVGEGSYVVQATRYRVVTETAEEAKRYQTFNKAVRAYTQLACGGRYVNISLTAVICRLLENGELEELTVVGRL